MLNRQQILEIARKDPRYVQGVQAIKQKLGNMPITQEGLAELVKMLELALNNPDKYPQIREAAVKDGMIDAADLPEKADPVVLVSLLVALYGLQDLGKHEQRFAQGGLARAAQQLQAGGRNGDTILAHINPAEAEMLRRAGGSGRTNPQTGLPEYGFLSDLIKIVAPAAVSFFAPMVTPFLEPILGSWASIGAGALTGAAVNAAGGANAWQGAVQGAMGQGLGSRVGAAVNDFTGAGMGQTAQNVVGAGLIGATSGAVSGQGAMQGAAQGALGSMVADKTQGMAGQGALGAGVDTAGKTFGNAMAAGVDPTQAAQQSAFAGLMSGFGAKPTKPSETALDAMKNPNVGGVENMPVYDPIAGKMQGAAPAPAAKAEESWLTPKKITGLMGIASGLNSMIAPPAAKAAVSSMSPQQQEYFNRPNIKWDWQKMQNDANKEGVGLSQYMAQNWPKITTYAQASQTGVPAMAKGGALAQVAAFARGSGSGRADTIDAKLSDGEYVFDAETTALLGDGSSEEGARRLDGMRQAIRAHKGKALAKGKISPDALPPLAYLKG